MLRRILPASLLGLVFAILVLPVSARESGAEIYHRTNVEACINGNQKAATLCNCIEDFKKQNKIDSKPEDDRSMQQVSQATMACIQTEMKKAQAAAGVVVPEDKDTTATPAAVSAPAKQSTPVKTK